MLSAQRTRTICERPTVEETGGRGQYLRSMEGTGKTAIDLVFCVFEGQIRGNLCSGANQIPSSLALMTYNALPSS